QIQGFTQVIGRDAELHALASTFTTTAGPGGAARGAGRGVRGLTGVGGGGETSGGRAYAGRKQHENEVGWWVRCEDLAAVPGEFRGLLEILAPDEARLVADPVQVVHAVLANRDTPWLLVLDNVAGPADLAGLVPASGTGHVLVTSQASRWPTPT